MSMKYNDPSELFKFIIEKADVEVINDTQKCLAVALDLLDSEKPNFKLLKIALNNNVYKELLKSYKSDSNTRTHCINKAIKILTDECFIDKDKAILAVGWLASVIYTSEWNSINYQKNDSISNDDEIEWESSNKTSNSSDNKSDKHKKEHFKDLFEAAEKAKNPQTIINMIKAGSDPNAIDKDGASVLWHSLNKDSHDITKALVQSGAKIDRKLSFTDENGGFVSTAFGLLCLFMGTNAEEFTEDYFTVNDLQNLISLGANVNCEIEIKSDSDLIVSPLLCFGTSSKRTDKYEIIECLLKNGAKINYKPSGISILYDYATKEEETGKYIDLLVKYGANINESVELIDEETAEIRRGNILNFAIWNEANLKNIKKLISLGADLRNLFNLKRKNDTNYTFYPNVILTSLYKQRVDFKTLKLLLDKGENINSVDSAGFHILFFPSDNKDIRKLIDLGADPYLETSQGVSFLLFKYLYAQDCFVKGIINRDKFDKEIDTIIRLIKDCNYDINRISNNGYSFFMKVAMIAKHLKTIKSFVSIGGKVTSSSNYPILPLVASSNQNESIIDYFASFSLNNGDLINESLLQAVEHNQNPKVINALIDNGANINYRDSNTGASVLDIAQRNPNSNVLNTVKSIYSKSNATIQTNNSWAVSKSNNNYTSTRNNNYYESTKYTPSYSPSNNNNDFNKGCANGCGCLIWLLIIAACQGCMFLK